MILTTYVTSWEPILQACGALLINLQALGPWQILCTATAPTNGGGVRDAMRKPLLVKAEVRQLQKSDMMVVVNHGRFSQKAPSTTPSGPKWTHVLLSLNICDIKVSHSNLSFLSNK